MARIALLGLVLITALLLDTVVLSGIGAAGASPSAVLLTVIAVGLTDGGEAGARYGFAAGLGVDLVAGGLVGLSALVYILTGFAVGSLRPFMTGSALAGQVLIGATASAAAIGLYGALSLLFEPEAISAGAVLVGGLVTGVGNGILAPFVIRPVAAALRRVEVTLPG
jgi:rod shape-determining protein MreD